ncbi:MAG: methyltransferase family protein [Promethearchaeota archaeon]
MIIIIITIILVLIFILNISIYWIVSSKVNDTNKKSIKAFYNIFPILWKLILIIIPIINLSFLRFYFPENLSYFDDYWNLFALLGIVFIIIGINFSKKAKKAYNIKTSHQNSSKLITSGVFRIIRHPIYSGWVIIFFGAAIISDSLTSLILCPVLYIIMTIHTLLEEKLILIPKYGKKYENFKEKTPYRIIPIPLNLLLVIITFIIVYIGFLNLI